MDQISCRANLKIVKELGDYQAQGRTLGNLGNTHYLLGNYKKAIKFHEEVCVRESVFFCVSRNSNLLRFKKLMFAL